ncbi:SPFH domain-containing protein [Myxococcus llanfairpwllgwyngyllgogerychwyrndrobwllllantysiliogogogochensis]|uniref:SPFH domain-containing protein n=1 Tax=Myxococcus llanfairpwllgwyngyllgogerychwyrndrobwllllantysiliogogogochensis TaxID=2590453 RepID=A0A540WYK6_9BACT|nr:SPFH domain-containing protein [Myxococcus llanfairpwllgwyngyllgogerychwyrndrobwllllantysiliogogogochensis]TQF14068.1 SPFH domain-containing protein [Myxococcus llanfairpwllgwyngyllgogerychwyrndrobwllllantysiliogogogochensis]
MSANAKQTARSREQAESTEAGRTQLVRVEGGSGGMERNRYSDGWRAGKPAEDPEKVKRWGLITARPSEFLVHMRRGLVREVSGQGASCFKLPGDSVAIVPTSIQRLQFTADQVTSEKVGVQVTGLAVYRIADPLVAFRMLNFSFPERAQEKLAELLREMFVGAARRLVANLSIEECLSRRKEGIAAELMREIGPVLAGRGRLEDSVDAGWGVLLDTIEIQDVRVLSSTVFENMQARFRREQERQAREAELAKERFVHREETEAERQLNLQRLEAEDEVRQRKQTADEQSQLETLSVAARVAEAKLAQERTLKQEQVTVEREVALTKLAAEQEVRQKKQVSDEQAKLETLNAEARLAEAKIVSERALATSRAQVDMEKLAREQETEVARARIALETLKREQDADVGRAKLELEKQKLAQEAEAAQAKFELVRLQREQEAEHARAQMELERLRREEEQENARAQMELERLRREQEQTAARHEGQLAEQLQEVEKLKAQLQVVQSRRSIAEAEVAIAELEVRRENARQGLELSRARALRDIENTISPEVIQMTLAQQLPLVAAAFQQKMGEVHVTAVDGANPFGYIAAAVEGVMGLARSAGLKVPASSLAPTAQ